jgi:hypothetical protein
VAVIWVSESTFMPAAPVAPNPTPLAEIAAEQTAQNG